MLQKGIIETIEDKYTAKVRIPRYDKLESSATGTKKDDLAVGIVCTLPGMNVTYAVGDIVLVDFENDELSKPVILGLLYRDHESKSTLELTDVNATLAGIDEKLSNLTSKGLYTHVKYSNDNGNTFTSLYDPAQVVENTESFTITPVDKIEINPNTKYIYWSIIDSNNVDITNPISITTSITGINPAKDLNETYVFTDHNIELPITIEAFTSVYLTFELQLPLAEANNYYITLTTDLSAIGEVYGDYTGICVSNNPEASIITKDYNWTSNKERNELYLKRLSDSLISRIEANERDIRGYTADNVDESTNNGLLDAILIEDNSAVFGLNRSNVYLGNTNQYIQTHDSSLHINSIVQDPFELKQLNKHLYLFYNED